eukprot:1246935-Amphidinium_carterae.1
MRPTHNPTGGASRGRAREEGGRRSSTSGTESFAGGVLKGVGKGGGRRSSTSGTESLREGVSEGVGGVAAQGTSARGSSKGRSWLSGVRSSMSNGEHERGEPQWVTASAASPMGSYGSMEGETG